MNFLVVATFVNSICFGIFPEDKIPVKADFSVYNIQSLEKIQTFQTNVNDVVVGFQVTEGLGKGFTCNYK